MDLVLDIGNSAIKGGLFAGERLVDTFRIQNDDARTVEAVRRALAARLSGTTLARVGVASVVPPATSMVEQAVRTLTGAPVVVLHSGMVLPFAMAYETPQTLGMDRLASAAAAWLRYGCDDEGMPRPVVSVDAGTAITYEVVDAGGVFRGGAIAPGPALLRRALEDGTAQLQDVSLDPDVPVVGRTTAGAMQSGLFFGFVDAARGMVLRLIDLLGTRTFVVATGGWGALLADRVAEVGTFEPHLTLLGIHHLTSLQPRRPAGAAPSRT